MFLLAAEGGHHLWEIIKAEERSQDPDKSALAGVALALPALERAAKLQRRGAKAGVPPLAAEGLGGELWALVSRCVEAGVDPEAELRQVARAYRDHVQAHEAGSVGSGTPTEE